MIYTVPDFQNPTGVTLSFARRKQLIALANCHGLIVLEDTPCRHIRFSGQNLPTLQSLDTEGRVIHLGSFSTVLVPGLRIGWAVAAPALLSRLGLLRVAAGTQTSTLQMAAASLFLNHHDLTAHIAPLQTAYARKQEAILDAIRQRFPQKITVTDPEGRPFIWPRSRMALMPPPSCAMWPSCRHACESQTFWRKRPDQRVCLSQIGGRGRCRHRPSILERSKASTPRCHSGALP